MNATTTNNGRRLLMGWMLWIEDGERWRWIRDGFFSTATKALYEGLRHRRASGYRASFKVVMCVVDAADGEGGFTGGEGCIYRKGV